MRKLFFKLSMLLLVLTMSVNAAELPGPYIGMMRGISSTTSGGTGKVFLLNQAENEAIGGAYSNLNWAAWSEEADEWNPESSNVSYEGSIASVPGVPEFQTRFYAYAKADDGSYFTGWSYYDGGTDLGINKYLYQSVDPSTVAGANNDDYSKAKKYTLYATFAPVRVTNYSVSGTVNVPADEVEPGFVQGNGTVIFDVDGEDVDKNDFYAPEVYVEYPAYSVTIAFFGLPILPAGFAVTYEGGNRYPDEDWRYEAGKVIADMHLKVPSGLFAAGDFLKGKVVLRSKAGSAVTAPFYIRYADTEENEASVTIGEEETKYATLAEAASVANANAGCMLKLLKDVEVTSTITLSNTMDVDLNGFVLKSTNGSTPLTIDAAGKTITIVPNNYGGQVLATSSSASVKAVEVLAGTLVLDGGTITAKNTKPIPNPSVDAVTPTANAIFVADGATLKVNEATIQADASTINAVGVWNEGATTINGGTVTSHAGMVFAIAAQAQTNTLTVNGGKLATVVDETGITASMSEQSTWSNSYAVYVKEDGTANIYGGVLHSTSTSTTNALAICAVGSQGTVYLGPNATAKGESLKENEYAFAVGMMTGTVTIDGAKLDATYMSAGRPAACPTVLKIKYDAIPEQFRPICQLDLNSCYIRENLYYMTIAVDNNGGFDEFKFDNSLVEDYSLTAYAVNASQKIYQEGYRYYLGSSEPVTIDAACHIGNMAYATLEEALDYANNNVDKKVLIIMDKDYTLPAGYYTLPSKAMLVIPRSDAQEADEEYVEKISDPDDSFASYVEPTVFRTLTLAEGVNFDVHGKIEASGMMYSSDGVYTGLPTGPYGHLVLNKGSKMTLQNGSELRVWGFVTGTGEIDARRGSVVRELFQMADWKGANFSKELIRNTIMGSGDKEAQYSMFPITQYYIQSVEAPVTYHPGARLTATAAVSVTFGVAFTATANDINVVGVSGVDQAIFLMGNEADAENTWVRKWYDAANDLQVYEVNNSAHIGSLVIKLGEVASYNLSMNSAEFVLPLTHNMKIHLLSGEMDFTQNTELLPGAEVEVDKEAVVSIYTDYDYTDPEHPVKNEYTGSLYIYDADQWDEYAMGAKARALKYSPTIGGQPSVRDLENLPDASINVHGTFDTNDGYIFTTGEGANIHSTNEDAGTFTFTRAAKSAEYVEYIWQVKGARNAIAETDGANGYHKAACASAQLKNGVGAEHAYAATAETAAGRSYCYINNEWTLMQVDEDNPCFMKDNYGRFYAKPADYVAIQATKTGTVISGNSDHTFSDAAGKGRLFILMDNCQWWEVELEDGYYHCVHQDNDTYYWWNPEKKMLFDENDDLIGYEGGWDEKRFTITWKNWDGSIIQTTDKEGHLVDSYSVTYGTMAEFLGTNPTREANVDYTYDFTGWSPTLGPVTQDVTYTATYKEKQRKYTIIFCEEGGTEIERHFLVRDEVPVCNNVPTKTGHILKWNPSVGPVTGDQTYEATWLDEPPTKFDITFRNYDGALLKQEDGTTDAVYTVNKDEMPAYDGAEPTKPATSEFTYSFTGWQPALVAATEDATYVAQFAEVAKKYTVIFQNEDGSEIERHDYAYGETPVCSATPTKANTAEFTYSFAWTPQIQTVQAAATYQAVFTPTTNKYTVTLQCNLPGQCSLTGAGIYDYGTSVSIVATPAEGYEFVKWQERAGGANLGSVTINGDITLTAVVKESAKEDPENLTVGINGSQTVASATDYMDVTLTSDGVAHSGQIINANNITLYGNADFVLSKDFASRTWYCVAVPWRVEANGGIYLNGSSTPAVLGTDIEICYYDGAVRAAQGKVPACWVYMKNLSTKKILEPGKAYMIALLRTSANQITFRKKVQEPLLTTGTSVQAYPSATATDANWNAIANPSLFHAYVNAGSDGAQAQRYNSADDSYDWFDLDDHKLVVGEPIYVQAPAAKSIVVANGASYAPVRRAKAQAIPAKYEVSVKAAGATKYADHLSVALNEDKETDEYIIGQDLVKFGVSAKVAQMWIDRYEARLCVNAVVPEDEATTFPMSIFVPKDGNYTIAIERENAAGDYNLYLTYNGEAIWNLSEGAYVANLNKGTDANYGLRISAKVPQIHTGVDEAVVDSKEATAIKVLINNQVFIIRGDKVYSIDGQLVK